VPLNNWAIVLKTNCFHVKEPSTRDDKKIASRSSERKKGTNYPPKKSEQTVSVLSVKGMKCKTCGIVYYATRMSTKSALD
jgi:hypothetical protein